MKILISFLVLIAPLFGQSGIGGSIGQPSGGGPATSVQGGPTVPSSCVYSATAPPVFTLSGATPVQYTCGSDNVYHANSAAFPTQPTGTLTGNNSGSTQSPGALTPTQAATVIGAVTTNQAATQSIVSAFSILPADSSSSVNDSITNLLLQQFAPGLPSSQTGLVISGTGNAATAGSVLQVFPFGYNPWPQGITVNNYAVSANACSLCLGFGNLTNDSGQIAFMTNNTSNGVQSIWIHANSGTGNSYAGGLVIAPGSNPVTYPPFKGTDNSPTLTIYGGSGAGGGGISLTGPSPGYSVSNPSNSAANVSLDWNANVPRLRVGGSGTGTATGFQIQKGGNVAMLSVDQNANMTQASYAANSSAPTASIVSGTGCTLGTVTGNNSVGKIAVTGSGSACVVMLTWSGTPGYAAGSGCAPLQDSTTNVFGSETADTATSATFYSIAIANGDTLRYGPCIGR